MQLLSSRVNLTTYFAQLGAAKHRCLFLDYDGTLAPFHSDPAQAMPYAGTVDIIKKILKTGTTRVVIVTGRRVADLEPLLELHHELEIWGSHGWERRTADGRYWIETLNSSAFSALESAWVRAWATIPAGVRMERKAASIALHWRGLSARDTEGVRETIAQAWTHLSPELVQLPFDHGLELRLRECTKARAVNSVLAEMPWDTVTAYLGDDLTDEDGFQAIQSRGLAVLIRPQLRETVADVWLTPPQELLEFLQRWAQ